jgi:hypothetical protein
MIGYTCIDIAPIHCPSLWSGSMSSLILGSVSQGYQPIYALLWYLHTTVKDVKEPIVRQGSIEPVVKQGSIDPVVRQGFITPVVTRARIMRMNGETAV